MSPTLLHQLYNAWALVVVGLLGFVVLRSRRAPLWAEAYRRLARDRRAMGALAVIALYGLVGFSDSIGWYDRERQERRTVVDLLFEREKEKTYSAPGARVTSGEPKPTPLKRPGSHWLGTDGVGADVFYRTLKGVRTAFVIGGLTSLISIPLALAMGLAAGYFGRRFFIDDIITYVYTVLSSIPSILLQIAFVMVMGKGLLQICVALGITRWVGLCRLVRGETLKHRDREYVRAARALGVSSGAILWKHILPNLLPVVIISATLGFGGLILQEAILSYLGIGVDASMGSWGNMVDGARDELAREPVIWWNLTSAAAAMSVLVLALNFFGDALRDAIDPRLRSS